MIRRIAKLGMATLVMAAFSSSSMAMFIYTYTGNPFTTFFNTGSPPARHDATDAITGFVAFTAPLGPNLDAQYVSPASFHFTDGVHTYNSVDSSIMFFSTDPLGHITEWNILKSDVSEDPSPDGTLWPFESSFAPSQHLDVFDRADISTCETATDRCKAGEGASTGIVFNAPGRWVESVPEPTTLSLLAGGLLASLLYRVMRSRNIVGKQ
jgi:hypothetical protein